MNKITRDLVINTAVEHKAAAQKNGSDFLHFVKRNHVNWLIAEHGWIYKQRAVELFRQFHPEVYDGEFIQDYHQLGFDLDMCLSEIAMRCLWRTVVRNPDLQVDEWGDLPAKIANPQMSLF